MNKLKRYRPMNYKEEMKFNRYLDVIHNAAEVYKEFFVGKNIIYYTSKEKIELKCNASNFMHLCGIYYKDGNAKNFYRAALMNKIELKYIWVKKDNSTFEKLKILGLIKNLAFGKLSLIHQGQMLYLQFDYAIRTRKKLFALTLKDINCIEVPQSLLNLRRDNKLPSGEKIIRIESIDKLTNEKIELFNECPK